MSDTELDVQLVKTKNLATQLTVLLNSYTKTQLNHLAEKLNKETKKSWRKDKLVAALEESILDQASTIYGEILEEVLSHLPNGESQIYRLKDLEDIRAFIPLIQKGFFFLSKDGDDYIFIIPDEIKEVAGEGNTEETKEMSKKEVVLKEWKEKQIAIFGDYSVEHLKTVWNRYYDDHLTVEETLELLQ